MRRSKITLTLTAVIAACCYAATTLAFSTPGTIRWAHEEQFTAVGPAVLSNGNIAVGVYSGIGSYSLDVVAPDGQLAWSRTLPWFPIHLAATPNGGIAVNENNGQSAVKGISVFDANGTILWSIHDSSISYEVTSVGDDGTLFGGDSKGNLIAFGRSGARLWTTSITGAQLIPVGARIRFDGLLEARLDDEIVYICQDGSIVRRLALTDTSPLHRYLDLPDGGSLHSLDKSLERLSDDGNRLWQVSAQTTGYAGLVGFVVGNDGDAVCTFTQEIVLASSDGSVRWRVDLAANANWAGFFAQDSIAGASGTVYSRFYFRDPDTNSEVIHAFGNNGVELWSLRPFGSRVGVTPGAVMAADGTLYVATAQNLVAINTCEISPARSIEPMVLHDAGATFNQTHVDPLTCRYFPAAAATDGANGTHWRTDLVLTNPSPTEGFAELAFFPSGSSNLCATKSDPYRIPAGGALRLDDVLTKQFSATGAGALAVLELSGPIRASSRTYTTGASGAGSYGQFVPALEDGAAFEAGEDAILPWLVQNAGYRTNIGFFNPSASAATVDVAVRGADGAVVSQSSRNVPAFGQLQVSDALGAGTRDLA